MKEKKKKSKKNNPIIKEHSFGSGDNNPSDTKHPTNITGTRKETKKKK